MEKINDIKKTLQRIPTEHMYFYNELIEWPTCVKEVNSQDISAENWDNLTKDQTDHVRMC